MTQYDAIVIGSGFGGAVCACRLSERGYRVLVLERGRRWEPHTFPRKGNDAWVWDASDPHNCNGLFDIRTFPNMAVVQGAAVGGGSIVYANVMCEAKPHIFERGWPPEISYGALQQPYERVADYMDLAPVPDGQWTERMRVIKEAADKSGFSGRFAKLELAVSFDKAWTYDEWPHGAQSSKKFVNKHGAQQGTCAHLGNCDIGCDVGAKNTLDVNYLYVAENRHHADIRPLHIVTRLDPTENGYVVHYERITTSGRTSENASGRLVLVCAGSLGSTEILLRCRDQFKSLPNLSRCLGKRWSSNGDFLTPALHVSRSVQADRGPTIAARIDFHDGNDGGEYWIQDGGFPNLIATYIEHKRNDAAASWKQRQLVQFAEALLRIPNALNHIMPWFAQGIDAGDGTLYLKEPPAGGDPVLHLHWDIKQSKHVIDKIVSMHKQLARAADGIACVPPSWSLFHDLITPHPLGGCNMASDVQHGVVDHKGEVFGYRNLFVMDGAVVPTPIGVNPSRTIAALAERASSVIIAEGR